MKLKLQNNLDYNWTWKGFPINQTNFANYESLAILFDKKYQFSILINFFSLGAILKGPSGPYP